MGYRLLRPRRRGVSTPQVQGNQKERALSAKYLQIRSYLYPPHSTMTFYKSIVLDDNEERTVPKVIIA